MRRRPCLLCLAAFLAMTLLTPISALRAETAQPTPADTSAVSPTPEPTATPEPSPLQVAVSPYTARMTYENAAQTFVYVLFKTPYDTGELTLYSPDGQFAADIPLPATSVETTLDVTVLTLSGRQLERAQYPTLAAEGVTAPAEGLDTTTRAAATARDVAVSIQDGRLTCSFHVPGRDRVLFRVRSPQESHTFTLYAREGWQYEGAVSLPCTFQDDPVTVSIITTQSNHVLYQEDFLMPYAAPEAPAAAPEGRLKGLVICIDAGHQRKSQKETVPLAPNMSKQVTTTYGMAQGCVTERKESIVVLEIAFRLRDELLRQGAQVVMTRASQDTFVGMVERANIPNAAGADFVLRLHCNARDSESIQGILVYCPYQSSYATEAAPEDEYRDMGFTLLRAIQAATGMDKGNCVLNNNYVGNNWSKMPSFLVEMGYMTNREEDLKLSTAVYQQWLSEGMAEGVYQMAVMRDLTEDAAAPADE